MLHRLHYGVPLTAKHENTYMSSLLFTSTCLQVPIHEVLLMRNVGIKCSVMLDDMLDF